LYENDAMSEEDLPAREAGRARRRDRDMAAEPKARPRPGMAKVFRQVTDATAKAPGAKQLCLRRDPGSGRDRQKAKRAKQR